MNRALQNLPEEEKQKLKKAGNTEWTAPMLAKLTKDYFSSDDWIFERKLDGERCLASRDGETVKLKSRNKQELGDTYPEIAKALKKQGEKSFLIDGEIVAFKGKLTSFSKLQNRMRIEDPEEASKSGVRVYFYVFDIICLDGFDLSAVSLRSRKSVLKKVLKFSDPIRFTPHRNGSGKSFYREACEKGWEGIIAKEASSGYVHSRSGKWLKFKCVNRQEFVICGFTDPEGERKGFGALLLGYYEEGNLAYAGKVGTGFDDETLEDLSERLSRIETGEFPFEDGEGGRGDAVHWVRPKLVCEAGFTEWTAEGKLRHPRYYGLRRDKDPKEVVREDKS